MESKTRRLEKTENIMIPYIPGRCKYCNSEMVLTSYSLDYKGKMPACMWCAINHMLDGEGLEQPTYEVKFKKLPRPVIDITIKMSEDLK